MSSRSRRNNYTSVPNAEPGSRDAEPATKKKPASVVDRMDDLAAVYDANHVPLTELDALQDRLKTSEANLLVLDELCTRQQRAQNGRVASFGKPAPKTVDHRPQFDKLLLATRASLREINEDASRLATNPSVAQQASFILTRSARVSEKLLGVAAKYEPVRRFAKVLETDPDADPRTLAAFVASSSQEQELAEALERQTEDVVLQRERDLQKLYDDIRDIHAITNDLADLARAQQPLIDHIEANVASAATHTTGAVAQLVKADTHHKAAVGKTKVLAGATAAGAVLLGVGLASGKK